MASCLTAQDVLDFNPCLVDQICVSNERLEQELCCALELIEHILGKTFCPKEKCLLIDGTGHNQIRISENILYLTDILIENCGSCCDNCCNDNCTQVCPKLKFDGKTVFYSCCDKIFPCGEKNIEICGVFGTPIPANIKKAAIQLALEETNPGITGLTKYGGIDSISWGDVSINYSKLESLTGSTTGFFEIDNLLENYISSEDFIHFAATSSCDSCGPNCECTVRKGFIRY